MKRKYVISLTLIIAVLVGILTVNIVLSKVQVNLEQLVGMEIENIDLTKVPDGIYTGKYKVFPINVQVKVTVKDNKILAIDLEKHFNGQGAQAEIIVDRVVAAQSIGVDIISGATYSSKIILKAIENALKGS